MMRWRERLAWLLMTAMTVASAATACSHSAGAGLPAKAARPAATASVVVVQCPAGQGCAAWQDNNNSQVVQDLLLKDLNGSPIWWVNNVGGMETGNDKNGVSGKSVTDEVIYMSPYENGTIGPCSTQTGCQGVLVIDGQLFTAADIQWIHNHGG